MRILILGWYYSANLGDAVICDCTAALLKAHYPQAEIVIRDMAGRTAFPQRKPVNLQETEKLRSRQKLREAATRLGWDKQLSHQNWCLSRCLPQMEAVTEGQWDLAVFAGGQLFMDSLALYVDALVRKLEEKQVPVIFNACGTGPSVSPAIRKTLAQTLKRPNVRLVSCRDDWEKVNGWCSSPVAVPTDDPALWAGECYGISASDSDTVGLGVLYPHSLSPKKTAAFWKRLIRALDEKQIRWKLFTNGFEQDMEFARSLLDGRPENEYLAPAPETPEELVRLIASFRGIIGFRLHSHIIGVSLGIPGAALVWDDKVRKFFDKMGIPEQCFTVDADAEAVIAALEQAEPANRERICAQRETAGKLLFSAVDAIRKGEA